MGVCSYSVRVGVGSFSDRVNVGSYSDRFEVELTFDTVKGGVKLLSDYIDKKDESTQTE